ncbi:NUDIX domain-containing protein [Chitinibacter sp. ZOR0017]|uniref:NUDIX domain-containing protein n=1 Tax=Chitinibacter sp. ZOR0017 TaxID=1339254 RepID=UPI0018CDD963|nr:NUDIX domain-containing protein [Chitinibacter sp. ZOR0017]
MTTALKNKPKRQRATVILLRDNAVLLTFTHSGIALLPGGNIERGELAIMAAARELYEETSLIATSLRFVFEHESNTTIHQVFLAEADGNPVAGDDAAALAFHAGNPAGAAHKLSPGTIDILTRFQHQTK